MDLSPTEPPVLPRGRLSRAAVFAGAALAAGAGCGGKAKPVETQHGTPVVDAGVTPDAAVVKQADPDPNRNMPMPYGAPPARRRLV